MHSIFINALLADVDYFLQYLWLKDWWHLSSEFQPCNSQSLKRHAVSVHFFLLMCLLPLEEAGWWKITAFPFSVEKNMSQWHRGSNTKEAMRHEFILVQPGRFNVWLSLSLADVMYFQFYHYRKRFYSNKMWHFITQSLIFSCNLKGFHILSVVEQLMTILVSVLVSVLNV